MRFDSVLAQSIPDTRGKATIETTLAAAGITATASVPSGKSTGEHEAVELPAAAAVENVNGEIRAALAGRDFASLDELDSSLIELDGTPNKARLGANAILSVSLAAMRLAALQEGVPLWRMIAQRAGTVPRMPRLFVNVLNGGAHADFRLPFQEYLFVAEGEMRSTLPIMKEVFIELGQRLGDVPMGDEGGYAPSFAALEEPFTVLTSLANRHVGLSLAIDAAASEFFSDGLYRFYKHAYSSSELAQVYADLVARFPLISIEDPFEQNAHADFAGLMKTLGNKALIVGDDLTVTDPERIKAAAKHAEASAVIIKPNQIGTLREALEAVQTARAAGLLVIASHRSGETADTFIADFAYGVGADGLKAGGFAQQERRAKYERLLAIENGAGAV